MKKWNKEESDRLLKLLGDKLSYAQVALRMDRTSNSIRTRANRLGHKYFDFNIVDKTIICRNCNKQFESNDYKVQKFCSQSCSASYTNKGKKHSDETKNKIGKANTGKSYYGIVLPDKFCSDCNKQVNKYNKTGKCAKCLVKDPLYREKLKKAMKGKNGGYRVKGGNPQHKGSYYKGVWMDSSWDRRMAERLDELDISWLRGVKIFLPWVDDAEVSHKYYPDYYLPMFDEYIEVKGYWTDKVRLKMKKVLEQNNVRIKILESLDAISKFIIPGCPLVSSVS